jgi:hypothetical protein
MTDPKIERNPLASATPLGLAKSSRLGALVASQNPHRVPVLLNNKVIQDANPEAELRLPSGVLLCRQVIDQRLAEIMQASPVGKQHSFFRIRFGVELAVLTKLPIRTIFDILRLQPSIVKLTPAEFKEVAKLNYNGELLET